MPPADSRGQCTVQSPETIYLSFLWEVWLSTLFPSFFLLTYSSFFRGISGDGPCLPGPSPPEAYPEQEQSTETPKKHHFFYRNSLAFLEHSQTFLHHSSEFWVPTRFKAPSSSGNRRHVCAFFLFSFSLQVLMKLSACNTFIIAGCKVNPSRCRGSLSVKS